MWRNSDKYRPGMDPTLSAFLFPKVLYVWWTGNIHWVSLWLNCGQKNPQTNKCLSQVMSKISLAKCHFITVIVTHWLGCWINMWHSEMDISLRHRLQDCVRCSCSTGTMQIFQSKFLPLHFPDAITWETYFSSGKQPGFRTIYGTKCQNVLLDETQKQTMQTCINKCFLFLFIFSHISSSISTITYKCYFRCSKENQIDLE